MSPRTPAPTRTRAVLIVLVVAVFAASGAALATSARAGDLTFRDVGPGHPFTDEITFAAQSGIATGFPDGTYRPGQPVSRQAMAAFLERAQSHRVLTRGVSAASAIAITGTARCDRANHVAISGGATYSGAGTAFMTSSGPGTGNGWTVTMRREGGVQGSMSMTVYAVCVPGRRTTVELAD